MKKKTVLPTLPLLPIKSSVLFPHLAMPLSVGRKGSVAAIEAALASEDKTLIIATQRDPAVEEPGEADLYPTAVRAVIKRMERADGGIQLLVHGLERVTILSAAAVEGRLQASFGPAPLGPAPDAEIEALRRTVIEQTDKLLSVANPDAHQGLMHLLGSIKDAAHQAYLIGSLLTLETAKEMALLSAPTLAETLNLLRECISQEADVIEVRQKIASQARSEISREQKEYFLRQQLRAIQQELGEENPQQAEAAELRRKLDEANLPEAIRKEADRELGRLERIPTAAPDYQLTRTYLELVAELPWSKATEDILDLARARAILDEDHYGLKEIKERIIEHLAVLKLNPSAKAPILCFVGPPGVGKTSLGKSIARSLGRAFERISLGGLHDEAELRGHRRTYIGAMPGRIIQAVRRAGSRNPVLMLDEVDKLGRDYRGDPAAALLEILDPAQNHDFRDNYLDLPFDLSKALFVCTANTLDSIPQPLLDRMELLRLAGYSDDEKAHIARRYLIPRQVKESGLPAERVDLPEPTLERLIRGYTREAGVRQLDRAIGSVCRKLATRVAEEKKLPATLSPEALAEMLGPEKFFPQDARPSLAPGVVAGLAWTQAGGEVLYVEAVRLPDGQNLTLTGQLGDVMKESAMAARSWVASHAAELGIDSAKLKEGVHIHVPSGATPKDGPSAGVTMAAALASLFTGQASRCDTAMTGEITLTGLVLPVGGVKEKVLAAHRAGMRRIILPKQNRPDLAELPDPVREGMEFIFAESIPDVLAAALPAAAGKALAA